MLYLLGVALVHQSYLKKKFKLHKTILTAWCSMLIFMAKIQIVSFRYFND